MWFVGLVVIPAENDVVELWQPPHSPVVGWFGSCAGVGRVTMVTPYQVLPASWQVAHAVPATGAWFIAVPPKLVNFVGAWQLSQAAVPTGMWVAGGVTMVTPKKLLPVAWQVAQATPATGAWFIAVPPKLVNFVGAWHDSQAAVPTGMCVAGGVTTVTPKKLLPVAWQVAQATPATGAWFIAVPPKLVNLVGAWHDSHAAVPTGMCVAGGDTGTTLANVSPVAWQVAHPVVMPVWFITATE